MGRHAHNLLGDIFGKLVVLAAAGRNKEGKRMWLCKCECGSICEKLGSRLVSGKTKSCGCKRSINLAGKVVGYWTVLKEVPCDAKYRKWLCRCTCGVEKEVFATSLNYDKSSSCGCMNMELTEERGKDGCFSGKHLLSKHPLYNVRNGMMHRCNNSNNKAYRWYGAKGVKVCDEWSGSFEFFLNWASNNGWEPGLTIDRIDPEGNYGPDNCRWISRAENASRAGRLGDVGDIFGTWRMTQFIPYSRHGVFECIHCGREIQKDRYTVTSGRAASCKCRN